MSESRDLDLPALRRRMDAHQATRPTDLFSPEMPSWLEKKANLALDIELREAEAKQPPFYITVPPQPIERPVQPLLRLRQPKPAIPKPTKEVPMPRGNPTHHRTPQARVLHLVEAIQAAIKKGKKLYWAQQEIRDLCTAHGLEVPPEAQRRDAKAAKAEAATPAPLETQGKPSIEEPVGSLPQAAVRFRALRAEALRILPQCEGLSPKEAAIVERQIDLLADVLALGVRMVQEIAS